MRHEVVHVPDLATFSNLRSEWTQLESVSLCHSQSVTYVYCELAARYMLVKGGQILVVKIYDDHGLALLWPVSVQRQGFVRIARDLRCGNGEDYGGPLMRHSTSVAVLRAAVSAIKQIKADVFELAWVDDGSDLQEVLSGVVQPWVVRHAPRRIRAAPGSDGFPRYAINLRDFSSWDDFFSTRHRSLRTNHNRRMKKLLKEQKNVEFGWCTTTEDAERVLNWLFANKRNWAEERGIDTAYLMNHDLRNFTIDLARRTDLRTTPLVAYVEVDGKPVAASFNLIGPKVVEFFVTTYDKTFRPYSVGILLLNSVAQWAHENGRDFDMRYLHEDYKAEWANHQVTCRRHAVFLANNNVTAFAPLAGLAVHKMYEFGHRCLRKAARIAATKARKIAGQLAAPKPQEAWSRTLTRKISLHSSE